MMQELFGEENKSDHRDKVSQDFFGMDDANYAKRFAKALKHAVELCGGKPSRF
ncbi:MAG: hypothetical protein WAM39_06510 [Bryobacteraceae bacterium]